MDSDWQTKAPSLADFEKIAGAGFAALPVRFREAVGNLVIRVQDFASAPVLTEMGMTDPFELTGLYDGIALTEQSVNDLPRHPPAIWLFRRPILDEWAARGDVTLHQLVKHVLVHEIAHHFGFSDEDIAAIDDWRL
ncbi:MAG: metallopeptidase family protein [Pseudomonadota bacterium]